MRKWLVMAVACVAALLGFAQEVNVDAAKQAVDKALRAGDGAYTPALRQAYVNYVEAVTRAKYGPTKINARTWKWLRQHPEVMTAAAAAEWPANPNVLLNFQRIALALGPQQADKWSQLALAYAIRYRQEPIPIDRAKEEWNPARLERLVASNEKGKGGDFALLDESAFPEVTEEEKRLGEWLAGPQSLTSTRPPLTIPDLMDMPLHEINMMTRRTPDDPPMLTTFPNWENVAMGGRIYPPYIDCTPTPQRACLLKIWRNGRIPRKTEGRPDFDMAASEWPILLYVADLAVTEANMASLSVGELLIRGEDGCFYALSVAEDGSVSTEKKQVGDGDVADNTLSGSKLLEQTITARELNVASIFADEALIGAIKAANIDVSSLFAAEAFISRLNAVDISGNESLRLVVETARDEALDATGEAVAQIALTAEEIRSEVRRDYASADDVAQLSATVSTLAEQTESNFTWAVTKINEVIEDAAASQALTEEQLALIRTYMSFGEDGLTIGKSGNPLTFRVVNDRLAFYMNNTEVAYLSNNKLYVTQAEILAKLQIGKFAYEPQSNGNLSVIYTG